MWIKREIESYLHTMQNKFPVILVTGPRQAGKTSLLRHLYPKMQYITFDDPNKVMQAENSPNQFLQDLDYPVILDEVQYVKDLFRFIKITVDSMPYKTHFYLTGSQQFSMMQNVSESLSGRILILNLNTLTYQEVSKPVSQTNLTDFLLKGGYPSLYSHRLDPLEWFPSYISSYLERDVRNILRIADLRDFSSFIKLLATRSGQLLNLSSLARDVAKAPNTIKSWISVLVNSGIIRLLEPYYHNLGKRMIKSPKIYFMDTGLLSYLLGIHSPVALDSSPFRGAIWETYCFVTLYTKFCNQGITDPPVWFWRDPSNREVDFIIEQDNQFHLIESKWKERVQIQDAENLLYWKEHFSFSDSSSVKMQIMAPVKEPYPISPDIIVSSFLD